MSLPQLSSSSPTPSTSTFTEESRSAGAQRSHPKSSLHRQRSKLTTFWEPIQQRCLTWWDLEIDFRNMFTTEAHLYHLSMLIRIKSTATMDFSIFTLVHPIQIPLLEPLLVARIAKTISPMIGIIISNPSRLLTSMLLLLVLLLSSQQINY